MNASLLLFVQLADRTLDCNRDSYSSLKLFWTTRLASGFLYTKNSSQAMWRLRRAGASGVTRTPDLLITNQLLYRLSYTSTPIWDSAAHRTLFFSLPQNRPFEKVILTNSRRPADYESAALPTELQQRGAIKRRWYDSTVSRRRQGGNFPPRRGIL